jgi:predicted FMN-binding regulatory protein PaiB
MIERKRNVEQVINIVEIEIEIHEMKNVIRMTQTKQIGERCDVVQVVRNRTQYVEIE